MATGAYLLAERTSLIITCAIIGEHQKAESPPLPFTLEEQVGATKSMDAGAAIIHARDPADPIGSIHGSARVLRETRSRDRPRSCAILWAVDNGGVV